MHKLDKLYFLRLRQQSGMAGFTLLELMIAMALTGTILTLAGFGVVAMLQAYQRSDSETARRTNLNRALDFMSDEIRMAKAAGVPANGTLPTPACGTVTGVLDLTMPDNSHIVYYLNDISSCGNTGWQTPATVRRLAMGTDALLADAIATPTTPPTCPNGTLSGGNGLYACIDSTNSHLVSLYLNGKLTDAYGNPNGIYSVSSKVVARSQ